MEARLKHAIVMDRIELLRAHIENVGSSPEFERELKKAESELQRLEQQSQPAREP